MSILTDFGHRWLESMRVSPLPFVVVYAEYAGRPSPALPARFASADDAIREWVFGIDAQGMTVFDGNVVDYFNRQLGVVLQPVGGSRIWHVGMAESEYLDAAGTVIDPSILRGLVKSKLAAQLAAAKLPVAALDTDGDNVVESPENIGDRIELLVLALDNLGGRGGQTGGTAPDQVAIGGNHSWAGQVSGLGAGAGVTSMCHELLHQLGTVDLYGAGFSRNAGSTTMAAVPVDPDSRVRLDPWHELQFGVTTPQVVDLTAEGSFHIEHAGGDPANRAILLVDPSRRFEGFLVQLRLGPQDPIDRGGPNGWCIWHVTVEGGTAKMQVVPSQTQAGGWDASINLLAAPGLARGGGGPNRAWSSGSFTPELHWWNGGETGIRLGFTSDASGIGGTVTWQLVAESWRWQKPALQTWAVGTTPCSSSPVVATDPLGGWPVVAAVNSGQMVANQTYDEQSVLPWGWPDRVKSGRDVAMVTTEAGLASAFVLDSGNILIDYPPWYDPAAGIPPEFPAPGVTGRPAITLWGDTLVVAWTDGSLIWTAEKTKSELIWRHSVVAPPGVTARPRAGTGPALVTTRQGTCFLAWNDDNLQIRILRREHGGDWNARFKLDYGLTTPAVLPIRVGISTLETPAMSLGPDGAVWFAIPTPGQFCRIAYGRAPAVLGTLEPATLFGPPSRAWPALWRMVDIGPIAGPVSVCPSTSGLTVAWTPALGEPAHVAILPTG